MKTNMEELLQGYRQIWNNRNLNEDGKTPGEILKDAMMRELNDLSSHPRVRKNKETKYYFAIKRVTESDLQLEVKYDLIQLYTKVLEDLRG